jgi:hypothetical protein
MPTRDELTIPVRCDRFAFPVYSLSHERRGEACHFVDLARAVITNGEAAHLGIHPSDSSRVILAGVAHVRESDTAGRVTRRYTSAELTLRDADFAVSVHFAPDGRVESVKKTEPFEPPKRP